MSISGSGTQNDPYIVDTWDDYLTAVSSGSYIKWADSAVKRIESVTINSKTRAKDTDFNGWTIGTLNVTCSAGSDRTSQEIYYFWQGKFRNLHVENLYITDPRTEFSGRFYNCFFDNIVVGQMDSTGYWWTHDRLDYDNYPFSPFSHCYLYECIIYLNTEDYTVSSPSGEFSNCEIYINYKWKQTGNVWVLRGCRFMNCYVGGKIDGTEGTGTLRLIANNSRAVYADNTIINIETEASENCTIVYGGASPSYYQDNALFVNTGCMALTTMNNGNNYDNNVATALAAYQSTTGDIKNIDYLQGKNFPVIADDDVRYPQYDNNNRSQDWTFRINPLINHGTLFLPFWKYPIYIPPVIYPIDRADTISVYDIYEPQNGFDHNGVAVLWPSECISYKEDKGRWDINLTHPIDQYGKWTYIVGQNCIKVNGQIFRIDETEIYCDANQQYIKAHANHITYDLNDAFIGDATFETPTGNSFEYEIIQASKTLIPTQQPTPYEYTFELTSDITAPIGGVLVGDFHDQTVTGALYGDDNSFANSYGGQVYRDNFHMSINSTMENLPASPAFQIRYGTDMTKISYKIDFSSWITELICENNNGEVWGIAYVGSEWIIHHNKTKRIHFTYPPDTPDTMSRLMRDGFNYWQTVNTPKVSIEVSVANIRSDPKYKDFLQLQNMDVGYTGTVYFEQMGIDVDLRIVSIKRNELTGEAIQIVLGNAPNSFIRSPVCSQTIVPNGSVEAKQQQTMQAMQAEIEDVKLRAMRTWGGIHAYTWAESKKYTWEEIKHGISDD